MPNWCDNSMRLHHEDITKIDALESELSKKNDEGRSMACPFQHLHPNPTGEWDYGWSCANWGTKWDADIIDWSRDSDNDITIYCNTAWSPPISLYEHLTETGWDVEALYHEGGCAFAGQYSSACGDEYYEYDITDKDSIDDLPSDIIDFAGLEDAHERWLEEHLEEKTRDLDRTDWFKVKVNPAYVGTYEVTTKGWDYPQFAEWAGDRWITYNPVVKWRGLAEEYRETEVD